MLGPIPLYAAKDDARIGNVRSMLEVPLIREGAVASARSGVCELTCRYEQGYGEITGRRIRISQSDYASASCSGSSQLDPHGGMTLKPDQ